MKMPRASDGGGSVTHAVLVLNLYATHTHTHTHTGPIYTYNINTHAQNGRIYDIHSSVCVCILRALFAIC